MRRRWGKIYTGMQSRDELEWRVQGDSFIPWPKKICELLIWARRGRETDQYLTHKPLKRASVAGTANRFFSAYAVFWWLGMPAQEEGWEMKLLIPCSLWRWEKKMWKIPQVTGMAIVKVRIRINSHLGLTLQLCLILCCPTQPQVCQKHPVTAATGIISSPSSLIWKNIIYNVLTMALIHWFNEPQEENRRRKRWFVETSFWKTKNTLKNKNNQIKSSHSGTPKY